MSRLSEGIRRDFYYGQFDLNISLQAVAVNVTLSKTVTICSIYLPPSNTLSKSSLVNLIDQLPQTFMLVGDFNGHSKVGGGGVVGVVAQTQMTEEKSQKM